MQTLHAPSAEGNAPQFFRTSALPDEHFLPAGHTPEEVESMVEGMEAYRIDMAVQTADEAHAAAMSIERQRLVALLGTADVLVFRDLSVGPHGVRVSYFASARGVTGSAMTVEGAVDDLQGKLSQARAVAVA